MRRVLMALLLVLAGSPVMAAPPSAPDTSNAVSATATAGQTSFSAPHRSACVINDGSNEVYIRFWRVGETVTTMTKSLAGTHKVNAGESYCTPVSPAADFIAAGYICDTAETATLRIWAED